MASSESIRELVEHQGERPLEEQLALLADLTGDFASSLDIDETLSTALQRFLRYMNAEAASVFLLESNDTKLVCHKCAGPVEISGLRLDASQGIVGKSVRDNACQMIRDVREEPDFSNSVDADTGFVTRSILCVPLVVKGRSIGAIELMNKRGGDGLFNEQDRNLVTALAGAASLAIHNARMAEALVEQERIKKELELAREIQRKLLPPPAGPEFPVSGVNIPAREVSGDFYDFLQLPNGRIYFNVADVSGKGMNA
ncbi:MAG: serine/threonine protein phosphatase, partial [Gammaproteobacteria bacterium]